MIFVRPYDPTHEFATRSKAANLNVTLKINLSRDFTIGMTSWRFGGIDETVDRKILKVLPDVPTPAQPRDGLQIRSEGGLARRCVISAPARARPPVAVSRWPLARVSAMIPPAPPPASLIRPLRPASASGMAAEAGPPG